MRRVSIPAMAVIVQVVIVHEEEGTLVTEVPRDDSSRRFCGTVFVRMLVKKASSKMTIHLHEYFNYTRHERMKKKGGGGDEKVDKRHQTFDGSENNSQEGASAGSLGGRPSKKQGFAHCVDFTESMGKYVCMFRPACVCRRPSNSPKGTATLSPPLRG